MGNQKSLYRRYFNEINGHTLQSQQESPPYSMPVSGMRTPEEYDFRTVGLDELPKRHSTPFEKNSTSLVGKHKFLKKFTVTFDAKL